MLLELVRELGGFLPLLPQLTAALGQMAAACFQLIGLRAELAPQPFQVRKQVLHELLVRRAFLAECAGGGLQRQPGGQRHGRTERGGHDILVRLVVFYAVDGANALPETSGFHRAAPA